MYGFSEFINNISSISDLIVDSGFLLDPNDIPWEKTTHNTLDVYHRGLKGE